MANSIRVEIREKQFVDENGKTISFNVLVLCDVPTGYENIDIELGALKTYEKQYLKAYLKAQTKK